MKDDTLILNSNSRYLESDAVFNELYPYSIQMLAKRHWTPIHIAKMAIEFLGVSESKVLDIGSGVGKFCLSGAYYAPDIHITGVEQRQYLIRHAIHAQRTLGIQNVSFINANFTSLSLQQFDSIYFFNSFQENVDNLDRIDDRVEYSASLYHYYARYLYRELKLMPKGTRLATYHSFEEEIPKSYHVVEAHSNDNLKFWIKL